MNWKVRYISPRDGWAIVVRDGSTYLMRPPYDDHRLIILDTAAIPTALESAIFQSADREFEDWKGLVHWLNEQIHDRLEIQDEYELRARLIQEASESEIRMICDDIERQIENPNTELDHLNSVLHSCLRLSVVRGNPELFARIAVLHGTLEVRGMDAEAARQNLRKYEFPLSVSRYGDENVSRYANAVRRRKHPFVFI